MTFPSYGETGSMLARRFGIALEVPPWPVLQVALVEVTLLPVLFVVFASIGRRSRVKDWLVCWSASIYLANVLLPHIPASIVYGGYTPGILTALLVNLPVCAVLLRKAVAETYLTKGQALSALAAGFVTMPIVLPVIFATSSLVAQLLSIA